MSRSPLGSASAPRSGALYVFWGAIAVSILALFNVLLLLQRQGTLEISEGAGGLPRDVDLGLSILLLLLAVIAVAALRRQVADPARLLAAASRMRGAGSPIALERAVTIRFFLVSILTWGIAEGLALVGFALALAIPPLPRLALTVYFTGALFLWLWSRPSMVVLTEARRRAWGAGPGSPT